MSSSERWAWCNDCRWTLARSKVEELVQLRAQEGVGDDTDDVAKEQAELHSRVCSNGGDTEIADVLTTEGG